MSEIWTAVRKEESNDADRGRQPAGMINGTKGNRSHLLPAAAPVVSLLPMLPGAARTLRQHTKPNHL